MAVPRLQILGLLGLLVSCYAVYVEVQAHSAAKGERTFKAWCDLGKGMSCSRVLTSKWAKMIGYIFNLPEDHPLNIPNTYLGILFYFCIILYPMRAFRWVPFRRYLLLLASLLSLASSAYLLYVLYAILNDICVVCLSTHIVNTLIFFLGVLPEFISSGASSKKISKQE